MQLEYTSSGVLYNWELVSSQGAGFILYPDLAHTKEDIEFAKQEIRRDRDVVRLRVANDDDKDYLYKYLIFAHPECRKLRWYEIEDNPAIIRAERLKGTSPGQFVTSVVLPNIEITRAKNISEYGERITTQ